jgi:hypothetical protein
VGPGPKPTQAQPSPAQPTGGLEDAILSNIERIVEERDKIKIYQVDHGATHQDSGEHPSRMMTSLGVAGLNNVIHFHLNTLKLTPHMHLPNIMHYSRLHMMLPNRVSRFISSSNFKLPFLCEFLTDLPET